MNTKSSTGAALAMVLLTEMCVMTRALYLPPKGPAEYSYSYHQLYYAVTTANASTAGMVLNNVNVVGTQYWSKAAQSQRGVVSSGKGVDKGVSTAAINRISVTNYSDTGSKGSLVTDYILQTCTYTANEGGAAYTGDDNYRSMIAQLVAAGLPVHQENVTNWVYNGESFGDVSVWSAQPPTGVPGREMTYTIGITSTPPHVVVLYKVNGTEHLPSIRSGRLEPVQMTSVTVQRDYDYYNTSAAPWPARFFDTGHSCPYKADSSNDSASAHNMISFAIVMAVIAVVAIGFFVVLNNYLRGTKEQVTVPPPVVVETYAVSGMGDKKLHDVMV